MFKLESYITPLLLSYVDKYIKNFKPEDSQLSLWGGDAVFSNLDLKLDVLERELSLPFTFVNGHIHELRIHVPWTKLGWEPVVITINTIECVLKLRGNGEENASSKLSAQPSIPERSTKRRSKRQEVPEEPPGYVQSLINRIVNNISIVFNNLILKYVEDDIVLSLNIKSAELFSVNSGWEQAFVDLSPDDPVLRKIINMQDLTICLDQRDASGKIETYQDPLLYRCSLVCRLYTAFDNPHTSTPAVTRMHLFCERLDFSITDQQLPMFSRLMQLCLALYYGQLVSEVKSQKDILEDTNDHGTHSEGTIKEDEVVEDDSSWGSWAWSFVPEILPIWDDEQPDQSENFREVCRQRAKRIFQFGLFVDKLSCIFKLTDNVQGSSQLSGNKVLFSPVAVLQQYGTALEMTSRGDDFVNVQMGVTGASLHGLGECVCGQKDFRNVSSELSKSAVFLRAGVAPSSGHPYNYLTSSLFDPLSPENCNQRRTYVFDWNGHLTWLTENVMVERFPAFCMDYMYELELPDDWLDYVSEITSTFLEGCGWHEQALCRMIIGPSALDINSSLVHRLMKFLHCLQEHEYPPYSLTNHATTSYSRTVPTEEEVASLEDYIPQRMYHITLLKPYIRLYVADHPSCCVTQKRRTKKKSKTMEKEKSLRGSSNIHYFPVLLVCTECVDIQLSKPMYPQRVTSITSHLAAPSENLLHHCYLHFSLKVFDLEVELLANDKLHRKKVLLLSPTSAALCEKILLLPHYWNNHPWRPLVEWWAEIGQLKLQMTPPQMLVLLSLVNSWKSSSMIFPSLVASSLPQDITDKDLPSLILDISGCTWHHTETRTTEGHSGSVQSLKCQLSNGGQTVVLICAPESTGDVHKAGYLTSTSDSQIHKEDQGNWIKVTLQLPKNWSECCDPVLLSTRITGVMVNLDPLLLTWLSYLPTTSKVDSVDSVETLENTSVHLAVVKEHHKEESGSSSTTAPPTGSTTHSTSPLSFITSSSQLSQGEKWGNITQWIIDWYKKFRCYVIQVDIHSLCLLLPTSTVQNISCLESWKEAYRNKEVPGLLLVSLPHLLVHSSTKYSHRLLDLDLPVALLDGWSPSLENFPWSITASNCSIYTVQSNTGIPKAQYIMKPTSLSATLAFTTRCNPSLASGFTHLGVCIHLDMDCLQLCCSKNQLLLLILIFENLMEAKHEVELKRQWIEKLTPVQHLTTLRSLNQSCTNLIDKLTPVQHHTTLRSLDQSYTTPKLINISSVTSSSQVDGALGTSLSTGEVDEKSLKSQVKGMSGQERDDGPKVSLWVQLTLPKFGVNLFRLEHSSKEKSDIWMQLESEEVTVSVDTHDVYSKTKVKVTSVNVSCYRKRPEENQWEPGPFEGITLCCNEALTYTVQVASAKPSRPEPLPHSALFSNGKKNDPSSHTFLSMTYTRALCKNVQQKWAHYRRERTPSFKEDSQDGESNKRSANQGGKNSEYFISEIDLKLQHFDVVLYAPLIQNVLEIFSPLIKCSKKRGTLVGSTGVLNASQNDYPLGWSLNTRTLPLMYVNTSTIRIFIPSEENTKCSPAAGTTFEKQDMGIIQTNSVMLVPQADNPLSRNVLRKDLFVTAQRRGTSGMPGSDIEDRQYQLDIQGISFSTVNWPSIVKCSGLSTEKTSSQLMTSMGENPAVEWNKNPPGLRLSEDDDDVVLLVPVVSRFDLRVTAAPAVVYRKQPAEQDEDREEVLICGHSLEVNAVSDIDFYISLHQMMLMQTIITANLQKLWTLLSLDNDQNSSSIPIGTEQPITLKQELPRDSGVECEVSILPLLDVSQKSLPLSESLVTLQGLNQTTDWPQNIVPFDVLLTASSIHVAIFAHERDLCKPSTHLRKHTSKKLKTRKQSVAGETKIRSASLPSNPSNFKHSSSSRQKETFREGSISSESSPFHEVRRSSFPETGNMSLLTEMMAEPEEDGYEGSEDSSDEDCTVVDDKSFENKEEQNCPKIIPLVYITVSQPHAFIMVQPTRQKLDMSCFDIQVQGAGPGCFVDATEVLPPLSLFVEPWVETRPGDKDPKTGIPPALYTLTINDFIFQSGRVKIKCERPIKLNFGLNKWKQALLFYESASKLLGWSGSCGDSSLIQQQGGQTNRWFPLPHSVDVGTRQLVVVLELDTDDKQTNVTFNVGKITTNVVMQVESKGSFNNIKLMASCSGLILKTSHDVQSQPLLGPLSLSIDVEALWDKWSTFPRVITRFHGGTIPLRVGPEHVQLMLSLRKYLEGFLVLSSEKSQEQQKAQKTLETEEKISFTNLETSSDDLRKGVFQYIQDTGTGIEPQPHEIVFSKQPSEHEGSMTWCYSEPRALTKVNVSPVPFHSSATTEIPEPFQKVTCHLQYWDSMKQSFFTYREFELSESAHCSLDLPPVTMETGHLVVVSELWRVVVHCPDADPQLTVSPLALAACMRVDSCFLPVLVPYFQACLKFDLIQVTFFNHFAGAGTPINLLPFSFDGTSPVDQEFMVLTLDSPSCSVDLWQDRQKIEGLFTLTVEILEYRNLTMQQLLEPVDCEIQLAWTHMSNRPPVLEGGAILHPCYLRVGQSVIHTMNLAVHSWSKFQKKESKLLVPNYYLICNDIEETIRFGQVDTDESIILASRQMHAYSWRTHKTKQHLHVCLESMRWGWSDPFSIDSIGTIVKTWETKGQKATVIIIIRQISTVQKQVILRCQLVISSRLTQHLEVQLLTYPHYQGNSHKPKDKEYRKKNAVLGQQCTLPSFVTEHQYIHGLRLRLLGIDTPWSDNISITGDKTHVCQVIKVPVKGKGQFMTFWCTVMTLEVSPEAVVRVVFFAPLFMVRNNIPRALLAHLISSDQEEMHTMEIQGQGQEHQLLTMGKYTDSLYLTFQMSPGMKMSSPPIELSYSLAEKVTTEELPSKIEMDDLCQRWMATQPFCWPFDDSRVESHVHELNCEGLLPYIPVDCVGKPIIRPSEVPDIELNVELSQRWPYCNTVLVDVKPWALLVNRTGVDIYLVEQSGKEWKILSGSVFVPPPHQEQFSLGVQWLGELYLSKPLLLSQDDWSAPRYWPKVEGRVPLVGHTLVLIQIVAETELKVCPLCITSTIHEGVRVVAMNAAWFVSNQTEIDLLMITYMVASSSTQTKLFSKKQKPKSLKLKAAPENNRLQPMLFWDLTSPVSHDSEYQQFVCLAQKSSDEPVWSYPVCVTTSVPYSRLTVSVPDINGTTKPYLVMVHKKDGLTYLITKTDPCPVMKLYNNTKYILLYGQRCCSKEGGYIVEEERTGQKQFPSVGPGCSAHYTPPSLSSSYPNSPDLLPSICLAKQVENTDQQYELVKIWSCGINLVSEGDQFVNIPDACDIRIHKERVSNTILLFIEPANRIEISAKEIRSRIGVPHGARPKRSISVPEDNREAKIVVQEDKDSVQTTSLNPARVLPAEHTLQYLSLKLSHVSLIVCDDLNAHQPHQQNEVVRVSLDQLMIFLRPGASEILTSSPSCYSQIVQEVKFHVGSIQVDNQLEEQGGSGYDFPVVILPSGNDPATKDNLQHDLSQSLLKVDVVLEYSEENHPRGTSITSLSMSLTPVSVYLEDTFFYKLFKLLPTFKPSLIHRKIVLQSREQLLPAEVSMAAASLSKPIHIHQFHIHPISLMLSLRASLKLYLSLDHTPLHFHSFQRSNFFSSSYRLGHMLTMHYLSAALLRAGWVLGSMDLLANPAGFARAVSRGLTDFVLMPYRGLLRGPWAFVTGVSDGAASMIRQITSGALLSVTNWAGSVSRNMDRLSMDTDHWTRQETLRRHHPSGLVSGLSQGLSGFGISLLGAVAGVIDQPLQALVSPDLETNSPVRVASGVVTGVGKGLVGVVAKPIGGAAELVSQAGQGVLEGAGWGRKLVRKYSPVTAFCRDRHNSHLKLAWKVLQGLGRDKVVLCVEATHLNHSGSYISDVLVLTSEVLCVVNKEEDTQQQTFAITEVECYGSVGDLSAIYLALREKIRKLPPEMKATQESNLERVADYIHKTAQFTSIGAQWLTREDDQSEASFQTADDSNSIYQYYLHPKVRGLFLIQFHLVQREALGRGFRL